MTEGSEIDRAVAAAARDALTCHAREGRDIPVLDGDKVVWRPAADVLAELDAAKQRPSPRRAKPPRIKSA
jgi:hypothetical protein